jgi:hypothetical protein
MATWKRILVEDDVIGSGIIAVTGDVPHTVSLGDPDALLTEIPATADDDKLLIWDESTSTWNWVAFGDIEGTNLGNSNLIQTDSSRTFDLFVDGDLEFHLNSSEASGAAATRVRFDHDLALDTAVFATGETSGIELYTDGSARQSRAILLSVENATVGAYNSSLVAGKWEGTTAGILNNYQVGTYGGALRLEGWARVGKLTDDTEGSETVLWGDVIPFSSIELGAKGAVSPAAFTGSTAASYTTAKFGGEIIANIVVADSTGPGFYTEIQPFKVDNVGVHINHNTDSYYLATDRGDNGEILTTDGSGGTKWENPLNIFLPELMEWVNANSGGQTIYGPTVLSGDFNQDGTITSADLLAFLGAYGTTVSDISPSFTYTGATEAFSDITDALASPTFGTPVLLNVQSVGTAINYAPHSIVVSDTADYVGVKESSSNPYGAAFNNYKLQFNTLVVEVSKTLATESIIYLLFKLEAIYDDNGTPVNAFQTNSGGIFSGSDSSLFFIGSVITNLAGVSSHTVTVPISEPMLGLSNYSSVYGMPYEIRLYPYAILQSGVQGSTSVRIKDLAITFDT